MGSQGSKNEAVTFPDFENLPDDMIGEICSQMSLEDLKNTIQSSHRIYNICKSIIVKKREERKEEIPEYRARKLLERGFVSGHLLLHNYNNTIRFKCYDKLSNVVGNHCTLKVGLYPSTWKNSMSLGISIELLDKYVNDNNDEAGKTTDILGDPAYYVFDHGLENIIRFLYNNGYVRA